MVKYSKYTTKTGKERWKYKGYWGIDNRTGYPIQPQRQGFKTKKEAKLDYERTIFELDKKQNDVRNKKITFSDLWLEYIPYYQASGVSFGTYDDVRRGIELHVLPEIGKYYVDMLSIRDCQKMVDKIRRKRKDFKRIVNNASSVIDYAVENEYCATNQLKKVQLKNSKIKYDTRRPAKNVYSPDELVTFLEFCKDHIEFHKYVYFRLLAFAGLRKSEALALKTSDLDLKNKTLTVQRTLALSETARSVVVDFTKTQHSDSDVDVIALDDITFDLLITQISNSKIINFNSSNFIFTNPKTNSFYAREAPNQWINTLWKRHGDELTGLGLHRITPHGLRHSHATLLHALGVSAKDAQHRLRHANIQTTLDIYTHIDRNQQQATAQILNVFEADKVKSKVTF